MPQTAQTPEELMAVAVEAVEAEQPQQLPEEPAEETVQVPDVLQALTGAMGGNSPSNFQAQRLAQQFAAEKQRADALEQAQVEQWLAGLPDDDTRQRGRQGYQLIQMLRTTAADAQQKTEYIQMLESALLPTIKQAVLRDTAQKEKVPLAILNGVEDPRDIPRVIEMYRHLQKKYATGQRIETRSDAAPAAAPQGGNPAVDARTSIQKHASAGGSDIDKMAAWFRDMD